MNTIAETQNQPIQIERLAAQRQLYNDAKRMMHVQLVLALIPIVTALIGIYYPQFKALTVVCALALTLFDLLFFSTQQKKFKQEAAQIQELFDCDVLKIPKPSKYKTSLVNETEVVAEKATCYKDKEPDYRSLYNWYPTFEKLPMPIARFACQRINLFWDKKQRNNYLILLVVCLVGLISSIMIVKYCWLLSWYNLVLDVLIPCIPLMIFIVRQAIAQWEEIVRLKSLQGKAATLWESALTETETEEMLLKESRELQDEIFDHRRQSPLVLDRIYWLFRDSNQESVDEVAKALNREFQNNVHTENHKIIPSYFREPITDK